MQPNDKLRQITLTYNSIIIAGVSVTSIFLKDILKSYSFNTINTYFVILLIAVISMIVFEKLLIGLIQRFQIFKKIIWGRYYLEGVWIDFTYDTKSKVVLMVNTTQVDHVNQMMIVSGENYDSEGRKCSYI